MTGLFYISFATDAGFRGATVVEADSESDAIAVASRLGLNPGGEAAILAVPPDLPADGRAKVLSYQNRLVGKAEILSHGGFRYGDCSEEMQDRVARVVTKVCAQCNVSSTERQTHVRRE